MLRYLAEHEIRPGVALRVARREPFGGAVIVEVAGDECPIGPDLAVRMLVDDVEPSA
jgi:Fe2+ transport system protein FeoA